MRRTLALGLALALAAPAAAQAAPSAFELAEQVTSGRLEASGTGTIVLNGRFVVFGAMGSGGSLVVKDSGGDVKVVVDSRVVADASQSPRKRRVREVRLRVKPTQRFYVEGSRVRVQIVGTDVSIVAAGRGRVSLRGDGEFAVNGGQPIAWPSSSSSLQLLPPSR